MISGAGDNTQRVCATSKVNGLDNGYNGLLNIREYLVILPISFLFTRPASIHDFCEMTIIRKRPEKGSRLFSFVIIPGEKKARCQWLTHGKPPEEDG